MNNPAEGNRRLAVIAYLAKQMSPHPGIGRTGIMKLLYLLQETKGHSLGYDFRLYTYGPYDSHVLEDLKVAEIKHAVNSQQYDFEFGRGYLITAGENADKTIEAGNLPAKLTQATDHLVADFGKRSAADLEMIGTVVFEDRAARSRDEKTTPDELAERVHKIKPYIALSRIQDEAKTLKERGLLESAL